MTSPTKSLYAGHRFPPELICHVVWLYFRFPLSLLMVEEMLAFRGMVVSHETIRQWGLKFGQEFADTIRRHLPRPGDKWHMDEGVILSANSGGRWQGGEARDARLGAWPAIDPVDDPRYVHRGGDTDLLKPGLRQPDVAAPAHSEGADAL